MNTSKKPDLSFFQIILPVLFLGIIIIYGLVIRPIFLEQPAFPLEIVFLLASVFAIAQLMMLGFKWDGLEV